MKAKQQKHAKLTLGGFLGFEFDFICGEIGAEAGIKPGNY